MKAVIIQETDSDELKNEFKKEFDKIEKIGKVMSFHSFFDSYDNNHKAVIYYYD